MSDYVPLRDRASMLPPQRVILEPVKTIGAYTIYRRKPKPICVAKYVVGRTATGENLEEFRQLHLAIWWIKQQGD